MNLAVAPTPTLPTAPTVPAGRSALVAAVLGWLIPGFGQLYMGRPFKALLMLVSIGGLFYGGLVLTGFTCVNPNTYALEFAAHSLLGGPTAAAYYLTQGFELSQPLPWFEVGRLYAAVAGLLNVVAICDALGDVIEHNRDVRVRASLRERYLLEREAERVRSLEAAAAHEASLLETEEGSVTVGDMTPGEGSDRGPTDAPVFPEEKRAFDVLPETPGPHRNPDANANPSDGDVAGGGTQA